MFLEELGGVDDTSLPHGAVQSPSAHTHPMDVKAECGVTEPCHRATVAPIPSLRSFVVKVEEPAMPTVRFRQPPQNRASGATPRKRIGKKSAAPRSRETAEEADLASIGALMDDDNDGVLGHGVGGGSGQPKGFSGSLAQGVRVKVKAEVGEEVACKSDPESGSTELRPKRRKIDKLPCVGCYRLPEVSADYNDVQVEVKWACKYRRGKWCMPCLSLFRTLYHDDHNLSWFGDHLAVPENRMQWDWERIAYVSLQLDGCTQIRASHIRDRLAMLKKLYKITALAPFMQLFIIKPVPECSEAELASARLTDLVNLSKGVLGVVQPTTVSSVPVKNFVHHVPPSIGVPTFVGSGRMNFVVTEPKSIDLLDRLSGMTSSRDGPPSCKDHEEEAANGLAVTPVQSKCANSLAALVRSSVGIANVVFTTFKWASALESSSRRLSQP